MSLTTFPWAGFSGEKNRLGYYYFMNIIRYNSITGIDWFNNHRIFKPSNVETHSNDENSFCETEIENAKARISGKPLRQSKYNILKTFDDRYTVIFNSLYDSIIVLNSEETELYYTVQNRNKIERLDVILFMLGIFLMDSTSEEITLDLLQDELFYNKNGIPSVTILPTQLCNARCAYCFAEHNKKISMTEETVRNVVNYINNNFCPGDSVLLRWFGGEPLLAEPVIDRIIVGITTAFNSQLNFQSLIVTNGSLLSAALIAKAKAKWNVKKVQLTLDGYGVEHTKRKNYADKSINYYRQVIDNITCLLKFNIAVDCRVNLDKENFSQLDYILNDLVQFKDNPKFRVRVTILRPSDCGANLFNFIKPNDLKWAYEIIYKKLFHYGFIKDIVSILPKRRTESCIAKSINKVIIGSDGELYKCLQKVFDEEYSVGNLNNGIASSKYIGSYCKKPLHNNCVNCEYLPLCGGGCEAYWDLQKTEDITPCIREKFFFDLLLEWVYKWNKAGGYNERIF